MTRTTTALLTAAAMVWAASAEAGPIFKHIIVVV
jgi:hypothetical protein